MRAILLGGGWMRINGIRVLTLYRVAGMARRYNRLPQSREKWFYTARREQWILWHWRPRVGYVIRALGTGPVPGRDPSYTWGLKEEQMAFARREQAGQKLPQPQLPQESKLLGKLGQLVAFVSDVKYDDNSPRTPGYFTLRNRVFTYELTLYDPDAGLRVAVRDTTVDGVFAAGNALLLAPDAPWEQDDYLTGLLAKKPKKKS